MLLQTNSYIVPQERRAEHARVVRRFRQALSRLGCDQFEVYEQVGPNWSPGAATGRYVQIMRFRDRQHQQAVQNTERTDAAAQQVIAEFCELINFPYQQEHGYFATGFYTSVLPTGPRQIEYQHELDASEDYGQEEAEAQVTYEGETAVENEASAEEETAAEDEQPATLNEATDEEEPAHGQMPQAESVEAELAEAEQPEPLSQEAGELAEAGAIEEPATGEASELPSSEEAAVASEPAGDAIAYEPPGADDDHEESADEIEPGSALGSFLDSLTGEDLQADPQVTEAAARQGHAAEAAAAGPPGADAHFAEVAIPNPPAQQPGTELVTADAFAPDKADDAVESPHANAETEGPAIDDPEGADLGLLFEDERSGSSSLLQGLNGDLEHAAGMGFGTDTHSSPPVAPGGVVALPDSANAHETVNPGDAKRGPFNGSQVSADLRPHAVHEAVADTPINRDVFEALLGEFSDDPAPAAHAPITPEHAAAADSIVDAAPNDESADHEAEVVDFESFLRELEHNPAADDGRTH